MEIVDCTEEHYQDICEIYNYYIENTVISFEQEKLNIGDMKKRVESYTRKHPWLVGIVDGTVVGYVYATAWQSRSAYNDTVELSCYLDRRETGKGYGKHLYRALLEKLKEMKCHVVIAGVALPNEASIKLQEYFGFEKVAHFKEVGYKYDRWIDVAYWQLNL